MAFVLVAGKSMTADEKQAHDIVDAYTINLNPGQKQMLIADIVDALRAARRGK